MILSVKILIFNIKSNKPNTYYKVVKNRFFTNDLNNWNYEHCISRRKDT